MRKMKERVFDYIALDNGTKLSLTKPDTKVMNIENIANALSMQCRFNGQISRFYSVAQHCLLVSEIAEKADSSHAFVGLMHDATEAYIGDLSSPIKQMLPDYQKLETLIWKKLCQRYELPTQLPKEIHIYDHIALITEASQLQKGNTWKTWYPELEPSDHFIIPLNPPEAAKAFIERFKELTLPQVEEEVVELDLSEILEDEYDE